MLDCEQIGSHQICSIKSDYLAKRDVICAGTEGTNTLIPACLPRNHLSWQLFCMNNDCSSVPGIGQAYAYNPFALYDYADAEWSESIKDASFRALCGPNTVYGQDSGLASNNCNRVCVPRAHLDDGLARATWQTTQMRYNQASDVDKEILCRLNPNLDIAKCRDPSDPCDTATYCQKYPTSPICYYTARTPLATVCASPDGVLVKDCVDFCTPADSPCNLGAYCASFNATTTGPIPEACYTRLCSQPGAENTNPMCAKSNLCRRDRTPSNRAMDAIGCDIFCAQEANTSICGTDNCREPSQLQTNSLCKQRALNDPDRNSYLAPLCDNNAGYNTYPNICPTYCQRAFIAGEDQVACNLQRACNYDSNVDTTMCRNFIRNNPTAFAPGNYCTTVDRLNSSICQDNLDRVPTSSIIAICGGGSSEGGIGIGTMASSGCQAWARKNRVDALPLALAYCRTKDGEKDPFCACIKANDDGVPGCLVPACSQGAYQPGNSDIKCSCIQSVYASGKFIDIAGTVQQMTCDADGEISMSPNTNPAVSLLAKLNSLWISYSANGAPMTRSSMPRTVSERVLTVVYGNPSLGLSCPTREASGWHKVFNALSQFAHSDPIAMADADEVVSSNIYHAIQKTEASQLLNEALAPASKLFDDDVLQPRARTMAKTMKNLIIAAEQERIRLLPPPSPPTTILPTPPTTIVPVTPPIAIPPTSPTPTSPTSPTSTSPTLPTSKSMSLSALFEEYGFFLLLIIALIIVFVFRGDKIVGGSGNLISLRNALIHRPALTLTRVNL